MMCCTAGIVTSRCSRRTASQLHAQQQLAGQQHVLAYRPASGRGCGQLHWGLQHALRPGLAGAAATGSIHIRQRQLTHTACGGTCRMRGMRSACSCSAMRFSSRCANNLEHEPCCRPPDPGSAQLAWKHCEPCVKRAEVRRRDTTDVEHHIYPAPFICCAGAVGGRADLCGRTANGRQCAFLCF